MISKNPYYYITTLICSKAVTKQAIPEFLKILKEEPNVGISINSKSFTFLSDDNMMDGKLTDENIITISVGDSEKPVSASTHDQCDRLKLHLRPFLGEFHFYFSDAD